MKTFFNLVIILQLFLLATVQSAPIHKTFCPMFPTAAECPPEPDNECNDDNKCAELYPGEGLKCCKDGCDLRCVPPLSKPVNTTLSPTTVKPVTNEVSGTCPIPPACECPPEPDNECINDNKCTELYQGGEYKCCSDGCGFICIPSLKTVVAGACPVFSPLDECPPEDDLYHECNDDYECDKLHPGWGYKCCKDGCGESRCVSFDLKPVNTTSSPSTVRPVTNEVSGSCPSFPPAYECPPEPDNECNNDNKCAELYPGLGYKCCLDGCDSICVPPLNKNVKTTSSPTTVRPVTNVVSGTCPVYPPPDECPPEEDLNHECNDDNKCAELYPGQGLKCCKDGCGEISCVSPFAKLVL